MPLFAWNDTYSVSVAEIDNQHKKLFALINDLHDAMQKGQAKDIIGKILGELLNYTKSHFSQEERYMQLSKYPDFEKHLPLHKEFINKITEFQTQFEKGSITLSIPVMNFLRDWLIQHIKNTDTQYTPYLTKYGLK